MNEEIMKKLGFSEYVAAVRNGKCPMCLKPVKDEDFEDELSRKEFRISGLCFQCQKEVF